MMTKDEREAIAVALENTGDYRLLRRLDLAEGSYFGHANDNADTMIGCAVDVETTGVDPDRHQVIELAIRRFRFNAKGVITKLDKPYSWLEDPWEVLDPAIVALTGITDADVVDQSIDENVAAKLFRSADVIFAHNAAFDAKFITRRLPSVAGLAWACSAREINWPAHGFTGRALGMLLTQCGWFHSAHRASADVDALIAILRHTFASGETALSELLATASKTGYLVRAVGAHFNVKDTLKARGYRWDPDATVWYREISLSQRAEEETWLSANVYGPGYLATMSEPTISEVTWYTRYR